MTTIQLITKINAPIQTVFDLNRDISLHQHSMSQSNEKAIAGVTTGLINANETVTFRGKHFGVYLNHKSLITGMESPTYFADEMLEGQFKSFKHEHTFVAKNGTTVMIDSIEYETPFGALGRLFDKIILKKYLTALIQKRNEFIKTLAENNIGTI